MDDYTIVEKYQQGKSASIAVRPYFSAGKENMGLEQYGLSLHDGVYHEENLACLEMNGVKRYVTGLNEFAPEVKMLDKVKKKAKITEIRKTVAQLEAELAANVVDPDDKDFWNKLTVMKPDNSKFWDKISLRCGNDPVFLDPDKDPYDLIKLFAINAGGFSIVAKSLRAAKEANNPPNDILYENMDNYINGFGVESSKKKAASQFLEVSGLTMEELKIRALVKDALYYRFITTKAGGWIEPIDSGIRLGKSPSECFEFLKNPENEETLMSILDKVEPYWAS